MAINFKEFIIERINKPITLYYKTKGMYPNKIAGKCKEVTDKYTIFHINGGSNIKVNISQIIKIDEL
jgi:hypothetical protein